MIGGYALAFHAQPRFTKDMDVWVEASIENAQRVFDALQTFGAPLENLTPTDLAQSDLIFQIGLAPNRIDIATGIDGVNFQDAWNAREQTTYGDQPVQVINRLHLVQNKRASGRPQDLIDLQSLEEPP